MRRGTCLFFALLLFAVVAPSCVKEFPDLRDGNYLMIVPDIQNYLDNPNYFRHLDAIVNYYSENADKIDYCLQVGDVTNNNRVEQWNTAKEQFFSKFPKGREPIFCLGNHDYGENGLSYQRQSNIIDDLLPQRDSYMEDGGYENYVRQIKWGGRMFYLLVLEFASRNETLAWADHVIKSNSSKPFIILTHSFLNNYGEIFDANDPSCDQTYSQKRYSMGGDYLNDSREIFDKIIYENANVEMVICGHSLSSNYIEYLAVPNVEGRNVHCIMVNYQHYFEGGSGNVGILKKEGNGYRLRSFCATERQWGDVNISILN